MRPRTGFHVAKIRRLPGVIRMRREERLGGEIFATGMAHASDEMHLLRHAGVRGLALNRSTGIVSAPAPLRDTALGSVDVTTQSAFVGFALFGVGVFVIGEHLLGECYVDPPFVLVEQLLP